MKEKGSEKSLVIGRALRHLAHNRPKKWLQDLYHWVGTLCSTQSRRIRINQKGNGREVHVREARQIPSITSNRGSRARNRWRHHSSWRYPKGSHQSASGTWMVDEQIRSPYSAIVSGPGERWSESPIKSAWQIESELKAALMNGGGGGYLVHYWSLSRLTCTGGETAVHSVRNFYTNGGRERVTDWEREREILHHQLSLVFLRHIADIYRIPPCVLFTLCFWPAASGTFRNWNFDAHLTQVCPLPPGTSWSQLILYRHTCSEDPCSQAVLPLQELWGSPEPGLARSHREAPCHLSSACYLLQFNSVYLYIAPFTTEKTE